jgi:hypothetical protein
MSIENATSCADIYIGTLTEEAMKYPNDLGIEWQGRNVSEIRNKAGIKTMPLFPQAGTFKNEIEDKPPPLVYRYDPISGTYRELIAAEGFFKSCGKVAKAVLGIPSKEALKKLREKEEKLLKPITKIEEKVVEWVKEHPAETVIIVVATAAIIVTAGAAAGAVAEAGSVAGAVGNAGGAVLAAGTTAAAAMTSEKSDKDHDDKKKEPASSPSPSQPAASDASTNVNSNPSSTTSARNHPDNTPPIASVVPPSAPQSPPVSTKGTERAARQSSPQPVSEVQNTPPNPGIVDKTLSMLEHNYVEAKGKTQIEVNKLGNLIVEVGNRVTEGLDKLVHRSSEPHPTTDLSELQQKITAEHQQIDERYNTNLAWTYDAKVQEERDRMFAKGEFPPPGFGLLKNSGQISKTGQISNAVEVILGNQRAVAQEGALVGRQIAALEEDALATRTEGIAQKQILKNEPIANTQAALTKGEVSGGASNRAAFEEYKTVLRQEMEKPSVTNSELKNIVDKIYRQEASIGSGSTAAAIRFEKMTGEMVRDKLHSQKGQELIKSLERWLGQNPTASPGDRAAAENIIKDLKNALE